MVFVFYPKLLGLSVQCVYQTHSLNICTSITGIMLRIFGIYSRSQCLVAHELNVANTKHVKVVTSALELEEETSPASFLWFHLCSSSLPITSKCLTNILLILTAIILGN